VFEIYKVKDVVRIPPDKFNEPLEKVAEESLKEIYEGRIIEGMGLIITVFNVKVSDEGYIIPGDGATYHDAEFDMLVFNPRKSEVGLGIVVDLKRMGAFINIGPIDGFTHISQVMDDKVIYDELRGMLFGEETKKFLTRDDIVRFRIVSVSIASPGHLRVSLTMRQPGLGRLDWVKVSE